MHTLWVPKTCYFYVLLHDDGSSPQHLHGGRFSDDKEGGSQNYDDGAISLSKNIGKNNVLMVVCGGEDVVHLVLKGCGAGSTISTDKSSIPSRQL